MRTKHWSAIADALRLCRPSDHTAREYGSLAELDRARYQWRRCVDAIADTLSRLANRPDCRFNRQAFIAQCEHGTSSNQQPEFENHNRLPADEHRSPK